MPGGVQTGYGVGTDIAGYVAPGSHGPATMDLTQLDQLPSYGVPTWAAPYTSYYHSTGFNSGGYGPPGYASTYVAAVDPSQWAALGFLTWTISLADDWEVVGGGLGPLPGGAKGVSGALGQAVNGYAVTLVTSGNAPPPPSPNSTPPVPRAPDGSGGFQTLGYAELPVGASAPDATAPAQLGGYHYVPADPPGTTSPFVGGLPATDGSQSLITTDGLTGPEGPVTGVMVTLPADAPAGYGYVVSVSAPAWMADGSASGLFYCQGVGNFRARFNTGYQYPEFSPYAPPPPSLAFPAEGDYHGAFGLQLGNGDFPLMATASAPTSSQSGQPPGQADVVAALPAPNAAWEGAAAAVLAGGSKYDAAGGGLEVYSAASLGVSPPGSSAANWSAAPPALPPDSDWYSYHAHYAWGVAGVSAVNYGSVPVTADAVHNITYYGFDPLLPYPAPASDLAPGDYLIALFADAVSFVETTPLTVASAAARPDPAATPAPTLQTFTALLTGAWPRTADGQLAGSMSVPVSAGGEDGTTASGPLVLLTFDPPPPAAAQAAAVAFGLDPHRRPNWASATSSASGGIALLTTRDGGQTYGAAPVNGTPAGAVNPCLLYDRRVGCPRLVYEVPDGHGGGQVMTAAAAGTGEGGDWGPPTPLFDATYTACAAHPSDRDAVALACLDGSGSLLVRTSYDGGATFPGPNPPGVDTGLDFSVCGRAALAWLGETLAVAYVNSARALVCRTSADRGRTWGAQSVIAAAPSGAGDSGTLPAASGLSLQCHQGRLYLLAAAHGDPVAGGGGPALWVSGDAGATWTTTTNPPPTGSVSLGLIGFLGRLQAFPEGGGGAFPASDCGGAAWP